MIKVRLFTAGADDPQALEQKINEFIEANRASIKIKNIGFAGSFFYDEKEDGYGGRYAALLTYEEKRKKKDLDWK